MPKCEADQILQDQMCRFVSINKLTINRAAAKLGVDRTTLWRFCSSGRARSDTKDLYRKALEKCNKTATESVSDHVVETNARSAEVQIALRERLATPELALIRRACEAVIELLDVYEAKSASKKLEDASVGK